MEEIEWLYARYGQMICAYVYELCNDHFLAEDITQEVFTFILSKCCSGEEFHPERFFNRKKLSVEKQFYRLAKHLLERTERYRCSEVSAGELLSQEEEFSKENAAKQKNTTGIATTVRRTEKNDNQDMQKQAMIDIHKAYQALENMVTFEYQPELYASDLDELREVIRQIQKLEPEVQQVLCMKYYDRMQCREIAGHLHHSENWVRHLTYRGKHRLADLVRTVL